MDSRRKRPQSATLGSRTKTLDVHAGQASSPLYSSPVHSFALRAQFRNKFGTAHVAWRVVAGTKTEIDRKALYIGLHRAGITLNQIQFETLWKLCDPEGSGLLTYGGFCAVFSSSDASASINRTAHGLRSGLRTKDGDYLGLSVEACVHDEADADNGTSLTFGAFERAVQRAKLNLGQEGIHSVWNSCVASTQPSNKLASHPQGFFHAKPKARTTRDVPHQLRQPFPDTGKGTCDTSRALPLAGGLPTRPSCRLAEPKWLDKAESLEQKMAAPTWQLRLEAESLDKAPPWKWLSPPMMCSVRAAGNHAPDTPVVQCALAIRVLREVVASSLVEESHMAKQHLAHQGPVDRAEEEFAAAKQLTAKHILGQWMSECERFNHLH